MTVAFNHTSALNQYGRNSTNADFPAKLLGKVAWLGIPFTGGACEVPHFEARTIRAADLHRHQINFYRCLSDPAMKEELIRLTDRLYHPDELAEAQQLCRNIEASFDAGLFATATAAGSPDVKWAAAYYICSWMGQGGRSGTKGEFNGPLSLRWDAQGGDSCARFRNAHSDLEAWHHIFGGVNFDVIDCFEFLAECAKKETVAAERVAFGKKAEKRGIYCDPPWIEVGDSYRHVLTIEQHRRLAGILNRFRHHRIVMRFGDHPTVRELYPEGKVWTYHQVDGRNQHNNAVAEVFLVNHPITGERE